MIKEEMRAKTKQFKHSKRIPFKNRAEVVKFLENKFGRIYSPYLDGERTSLYYTVPDYRCKSGERHIATYEKDVLRY